MKLNDSLAAIITGGASGLGHATARALAAHGVKVALFDKNAEIGPGRAQEIGGLFCEVDVTDEASVVAGFDKPAPRTARSACWSTAPAAASAPSRPWPATGRRARSSLIRWTATRRRWS